MVKGLVQMKGGAVCQDVSMSGWKMETVSGSAEENPAVKIEAPRNDQEQLRRAGKSGKCQFVVK